MAIATPAEQIAKIEFLAVRQLMDEVSLIESPRKFPAAFPS